MVTAEKLVKILFLFYVVDAHLKNRLHDNSFLSPVWGVDLPKVVGYAHVWGNAGRVHAYDSGSLRVNPEKIRAYDRYLLQHCPTQFAVSNRACLVLKFMK